MAGQRDRQRHALRVRLQGPDTAIAINRLLKDGAHVAFDGPSHVAVTGIARDEDRADRAGTSG